MLLIRQSGAIVVRLDQEEPRVLLVTAKRNPDRWIFPKGHVEKNETAEEAALREAREEAGVIGKVRRAGGSSGVSFSRRGLSSRILPGAAQAGSGPSGEGPQPELVLVSTKHWSDCDSRIPGNFYGKHGSSCRVKNSAFPLWKCEECAQWWITNLPLARAKTLSYVVIAKTKTDPFRFGETRPIACPVHVAVARRRAEQEVDPRFSRLAALTLVNQMAASHLGIEAGAPEAIPQTLQFRRWPKEEERRSKFSDSG